MVTLYFFPGSPPNFFTSVNLSFVAGSSEARPDTPSAPGFGFSGIGSLHGNSNRYPSIAAAILSKSPAKEKPAAIRTPITARQTERKRGRVIGGTPRSGGESAR